MQQLFHFMLCERVCLQEGQALGEITEVPHWSASLPLLHPHLEVCKLSQKCQEKTPGASLCETGAQGTTRRWAGAVTSWLHGSVFPMVTFKDTARVTLPWEAGWDGGCTWFPSALSELQVSKSQPSLPCAVTPMQTIQADCMSQTKTQKRGAQCPMRLLHS